MRAIGRGSLSSFLMVLLNISWWVIAAALGFVALVAVLSAFVTLPGMRLTIPVSFSLDVAKLPLAIAARENAPGGDVRVGGPGFGFEVGQEAAAAMKDAQLHVSGSLRFPTRERALVIGNAMSFAVLLAIGLWMIGQLRAVFRTLRDGEPFVRANATRIRLIGFAIIAGELARAAVVFGENYYAMTHFSAAALRFDAWPDLDVFAIVHGLVILVISEVFRAGTRLDEDQSLTV